MSSIARFTRHARPAVGAVVLAALTSCEHAAPYQAESNAESRPLSPSPPVQLTYATGADTDPAWLPGDSGIVYGAHFAEGGLEESCLAVLPPGGFRISRRVCPDSPFSPDTADRFVAPAPLAGGRVAYVHTRRRVFAAGFASYELLLGALERGGPPTVIARLPYTLAGEPTYTGASHVRWVGPDTIVYRGDFEGTVCLTSPPCVVYEARSGRGLVLHRISTGERALIPGTRYASSVAVAGGAIVYTLGGDTRVFRRDLATDQVTVLHDFGYEIVREVQVAGDRLAVIAGGNVSFYEIASVGLVQVDRGGSIRLVDLASGAVSGVDASRPWRQLALSGDGRRLVAESAGDLFLIVMP